MNALTNLAAMEESATTPTLIRKSALGGTTVCALLGMATARAQTTWTSVDQRLAQTERHVQSLA